MRQHHSVGRDADVREPIQNGRQPGATGDELQPGDILEAFFERSEFRVGHSVERQIDVNLLVDDDANAGVLVCYEAPPTLLAQRRECRLDQLEILGSSQPRLEIRKEGRTGINAIVVGVPIIG